MGFFKWMRDEKDADSGYGLVITLFFVFILFSVLSALILLLVLVFEFLGMWFFIGIPVIALIVLWHGYKTEDKRVSKWYEH